MANISVQCNMDKQGIISAYSFSLLHYLLRDEDISGGQSQSKLHQQLCLESSSTSATRIPSRAFLISSGNSISTKVEINCMGSLQAVSLAKSQALIFHARPSLLGSCTSVIFH
ncbi:hypothetical protein WN943_010429 [Citrus x changshan-huyou]